MSTVAPEKPSVAITPARRAGEGRDSELFPRYPKYKDSGIAMLGEVPLHWAILGLKHIAVIDNSGCYGDDPESGGTILPVATTAQIDVDGRFDVEQMPRRAFSDDDVARYGCGDGDILVVKSSGSATNIISGKAGLVDHQTPRFVFSNFLMRVQSDASRALPKFVYLLLTSRLTRERIQLMCSTTTYPNLDIGEYSSSKLPLPPLNEQGLIVAFLDRQTAKIDALVAEQEKLIALLKEKRQALISHAVTRGLDPNVPMKDSGIEWLGQVPAHWDVLPFRRCVYIAQGQVDPELPQFRDMVLIAPNHVESGTGIITVLESVEQQAAISGKYLCNLGDVIYSKIRPALRKACLAPRECLCSADMYPLRPHDRLTSEFLLSYILSEQFSSLATLASQRVAMPKINRETLNEVPILVPPEHEQIKISEYIRTATAELDGLVAEAEQAISLLGERRAALISAAVTGKIDVREAT